VTAFRVAAAERAGIRPAVPGATLPGTVIQVVGWAAIRAAEADIQGVAEVDIPAEAGVEVADLPAAVAGPALRRSRVVRKIARR
jgi:hypothetical protein